MRRVRGLSNATKRLRGFGLAVIAVLATAGLALVGFSAASSSANGADSEIDNFILLNGTSQCAASPDRSQFDLTTDFTVEAWMYPTSAASDTEAMIINKEQSYEFAIRSGTFQYAIMGTVNNWDWRDTGIRANSDQWQHVAFSKANNTVTLYINGVSVYSLTNATFANTNIRPSNLAFNVGCRASSAGTSMASFFGGRLDEVRLWDVARSQPDISRDMHRNSIAGASGLVGYWDFNEPSDSTVFDRTENAGNLTLYGSPSRVDVKQVSAASDGDTVITFPRTYLPGVGGWTVPENATGLSALVVAGGGSGGNTYDNPGAGGGGGGGFLDSSLGAPQLSSTVSVVIGQGGQPSRTSVDAAGRNGQSSVFASLIASGGGGGGGRDGVGLPGGSGGGGGGRNITTGLGGSATAGQGSNGGRSSGGTFLGGGGGGGAGSAGGNTSGSTGGIAGSARTSPTFGYTHSSGGSGGTAYTTRTSADGATNTGNGGQGASAATGAQRQGGAGGSGVVIVRYTPTKDLAWMDEVTSGNVLSRAEQLINSSADFTFEAWVYPVSKKVSTRQFSLKWVRGIPIDTLCFCGRGRR